jgi:hypothetical protein
VAEASRHSSHVPTLLVAPDGSWDVKRRRPGEPNARAPSLPGFGKLGWQIAPGFSVRKPQALLFYRVADYLLIALVPLLSVTSYS